MASDLKPRWYLDLMKPNSNGDWLILLELYTNAQAFNDLLDDLAAPFQSDEIDLVAGPEAMGFAMGAGIAARLRKGFLPIRKVGKLSPPTDVAEYPHHKGGGMARLELQIPSIQPGVRILLVDQWIETGGSMQASVDLVTRQGADVVGIAALCIEDGKSGERFRSLYKSVTAVQPGTLLQRQCSAHSFEVT